MRIIPIEHLSTRNKIFSFISLHWPQSLKLLAVHLLLLGLFLNVQNGHFLSYQTDDNNLYTWSFLLYWGGVVSSFCYPLCSELRLCMKPISRHKSLISPRFVREMWQPRIRHICSLRPSDYTPKVYECSIGRFFWLLWRHTRYKWLLNSNFNCSIYFIYCYDEVFSLGFAGRPRWHLRIL